jgi:glutamyl/glutaminyl-tRNA synthetase
MIYNTRFNPTLNGYLHLGHLYNVLINYHEAKRSGGSFHVRLDDNQRAWLYNNHGKEHEYREQIELDFKWVGIAPSFWSSQEEIEIDARDMMQIAFEYKPRREDFTAPFGAEVIGMPCEFYPVADKLTSEKVVLDFMEHVNLVIRGIDLLSEDCLYRYFVQKFRIPQPRMVYIPRLAFDGSGVVSKTEGNYKLKTYRERGMPAQEVLDHLGHDVLKDPDQGWYLDNIKHQPVLGKWANAVRS